VEVKGKGVMLTYLWVEPSRLSSKHAAGGKASPVLASTTPASSNSRLLSGPHSNTLSFMSGNGYEGFKGVLAELQALGSHSGQAGQPVSAEELLLEALILTSSSKKLPTIPQEEASTGQLNSDNCTLTFAQNAMPRSGERSVHAQQQQSHGHGAAQKEQEEPGSHMAPITSLTAATLAAYLASHTSGVARAGNSGGSSSKANKWSAFSRTATNTSAQFSQVSSLLRRLRSQQLSSPHSASNVSNGGHSTSHQANHGAQNSGHTTALTRTGTMVISQAEDHSGSIYGSAYASSHAATTIGARSGGGGGGLTQGPDPSSVAGSATYLAIPSTASLLSILASRSSHAPQTLDSNDHGTPGLVSVVPPASPERAGAAEAAAAAAASRPSVASTAVARAQLLAAGGMLTQVTAALSRMQRSHSSTLALGSRAVPAASDQHPRSHLQQRGGVPADLGAAGPDADSVAWVSGARRLSSGVLPPGVIVLQEPAA